MLIELAFSVACLAGAEPPAAPLEETQIRLGIALARHVHLRLALGDGSGAAKAFGALAAVSEDTDLVAQAAFTLLDLYENNGLPDDIRANLISPDDDLRARALDQLTGALKAFAAEHKLPADLRGCKVLGPADGCPVRSARAFAQGPNGGVLILSTNALVACDGARWQAAPDFALRIRPPVDTVFVDRQGRRWLGSSSPGHAAEALPAVRPSTPAPADPAAAAVSLLAVLRRFGWGAVGYFDQPNLGLALGRWHVFSGTEAVTSFAETKDACWLGGPARLFVYDGERARPANCPLPYSPFRKLLAAADSDILWVVDRDRISRFDGRQWESFRLDGQEPRGGAVAKDRPVVLLRSGLLALSGGKFSLVESPRDAGDLAAIAAAPDGRLWCVSDRGHVLATDLKTWTVYAPPADLRRPDPRPAIFADATGRVWLSRGRGIELCGAEPATPTTSPAVSREVSLRPASLVSAAGSGGWLEDGVRLELGPAPDEQPSEQTPPADDDLGRFPEDEKGAPHTPRSLLEELRRTPSAPATFDKLLKLLAKSPDPAIRNETFLLAVSGRNRAFFSNPPVVSEYAEALIDQGLPTQACMLLLDAWQENRPAPLAQALRPTLFEALLAMGFGEFASPAFVDVDFSTQWTSLFFSTAPIGDGAPLPSFRSRKFGVTPGPAASDLEKAGLPQAAILADKRALLDSMGDVALWRKLIDDCASAGDFDAAERYASLTKRMFGLRVPGADARPKPPETRSVDSARLSAFRWIRRVNVGVDSGLGPVCDGTALYVLDEGAANVTAVALADGRTLGSVPVAEGTVRALLPSETGLVLILRRRDGSFASIPFKAAPALSAASTAARVDGLSDSFDGFSATAVRDGAFYCFDGGLTKVDLNAGKVLWRNRQVTDGVNFWRTLIERSLPAPSGDDVFVAADHKLSCLAASTGQVRWSKRCGATCTPAVVGNVVVVDAARSEVWGLNRNTGEPAWKHIGPADPEGPFVTDGERVFYAMVEGDVAALDAKTGEFLWRRPTDIALTPPSSPNPRPAALAVRGSRLVVCNQFGYVEFDAKTGGVIRRLELRTARPLASTKDAVIVATAPNRFVAVADPASRDLAAGIMTLAQKAAAGKKPTDALALARFVAAYVDPSDLSAHELALETARVGAEPQAQALYRLLLLTADPFDPKTRSLMRKHLAHAPTDGLSVRAAFELVVRAHVERGAVREAADAFDEVARTQRNPEALRALLWLQSAAGDQQGALRTADQLAALGVRGAEAAVAVLAAQHREDEALEIAARMAGPQEAAGLLHMAIGLSGNMGLFEKARGMLDRATFIPAPVHGHCLAYLLSNAGVGGRVVQKDAESLAREIDRFRKLLVQRRDALKDLNQPEELEAVEAQLRALEKVEFP